MASKRRSVRMALRRFFARRDPVIDIIAASLAIAFVWLGLVNDGRFGSPTIWSRIAEAVITAIFAAEYAARYYAALDRPRFIRTHLIDLLSVLSAIASVPGLQLFRLLRLARLFRVLTGIARFIETLGKPFRDPLIASAVIGLIALLFLGTGAFLEFEKGDNPAVRDVIDAFWLAFSTIFTIGFAAAKPVTPEGRVTSALLIIGGLTCISFFTTTLTNRFRRAEEDAILGRLERIERLLERLTLGAPEVRSTGVAGGVGAASPIPKRGLHIDPLVHDASSHTPVEEHPRGAAAHVPDGEIERIPSVSFPPSSADAVTENRASQEAGRVSSSRAPRGAQTSSTSPPLDPT